ncbi:MAG: hypothetical protein HYR68_14050 [Burkholderiales bacterium]|nr:hypothetical protein [Burkholderiales bacterium]MBI3729673.1 hypothetical protein [Burkholderiales bacterium]
MLQLLISAGICLHAMSEKAGSLKYFGVLGGACSHNGAVLVSVVIDFKLLELHRVLLAARAMQLAGNNFILHGSIKLLQLKRWAYT